MNAREERQVIVSWCPVRSGYLRKIIHAQDSVRKAKSFDVILSGMAVNKVHYKIMFTFEFVYE